MPTAPQRKEKKESLTACVWACAVCLTVRVWRMRRSDGAFVAPKLGVVFVESLSPWTVVWWCKQCSSTLDVQRCGEASSVRNHVPASTDAGRHHSSYSSPPSTKLSQSPGLPCVLFPPPGLSPTTLCFPYCPPPLLPHLAPNHVRILLS